jgi:hypothetical protein
MLRADLALSEDHEYLECLAAANPQQLARLRRQTLKARIVLESRLLKRPPLCDLRQRNVYLLAMAAGGAFVVVLAGAAQALRCRRPGR